MHLGHACKAEYADVSVHLVRPLDGNNRLEEASSLNEKVALIAKQRKVFSDELVVAEDTPLSVALAKGIGTAVASFFTALSLPHGRKTFLQPHETIEISAKNDPELLHKVLGHTSELSDPRWDTFRLLGRRFLKASECFV